MAVPREERKQWADSRDSLCLTVIKEDMATEQRAIPRDHRAGNLQARPATRPIDLAGPLRLRIIAQSFALAEQRYTKLEASEIASQS